MNARKNASTRPMTQPGAESGQTFSETSLYAVNAGGSGVSPPQPSLTISTETPATTAPKRSSRYAKPVMTPKPAEKPASEALMKKYGVRLGKSGGKPILYIPCTAPENAYAEIIEAFRDGR